MSALSTENSRILNNIGTMLTTLRQINPTMTIQVAHTLLLVAQNSGASVTQISKSSGLPLSTMSRNLMDLGSRNRKREPGLGLVQSVVDDLELRKKNVTLTPKGEMLVKRLTDIMRV